MKKTKGKNTSIPIIDPRLTMRSFLPREFGNDSVHVIISTNPDVALADTLLAFASLASGLRGLYGAVTSASNIVLMLRILSVCRGAKKIKDLLARDLHLSSVQVGNGGREVDLSKEYGPLSPFTLSELLTGLGAHGLTITVITGDLKRTVSFNTGTDAEIQAEHDGVRVDGELHAWNTMAFPTHHVTKRAPCLVRLEDRVFLLFREHRNTSPGRQFMAEAAELKMGPDEKTPGTFEVVPRQSSRPDHGYPIEDGMGATVFNGRMYAAFRMMHSDVLIRAYDASQPHPFSGYDAKINYKDFGVKIVGRPSCTVLGDDAITVARSAYKNKRVIIAREHKYGGMVHTELPFSTDYPPGVCAFKGRLYVATVEEVNGGMTIWHSRDMMKWETMTFQTHVSLNSSAGPALVEYEGKLFVIYRERRGTGICYAWSADGNIVVGPPKGLEYFGFSSATDPSAIALPNGGGIMVSGIRPESSESATEAIFWTVLSPYEPQRRARQKKAVVKKAVAKKAAPAKKTVVKKAAPAAKPAKKVPAKKVVAKKAVAKKTIVKKAVAPKKAVAKKAPAKKVVAKKAAAPKRAAAKKAAPAKAVAKKAPVKKVVVKKTAAKKKGR